MMISIKAKTRSYLFYITYAIRENSRGNKHVIRKGKVSFLLHVTAGIVYIQYICVCVYVYDFYK